MRVLSHIPFRHILLGLATLALLSLPFAHRAGSAPLTPEISDYLAMGGTIKDLCGKTGLTPTTGCEACRLADTLLLTSPEPAWRALQMSTAVQLILASQISIAKKSPHSSPPTRAPPLA